MQTTRQRKNILLISLDDCVAYWNYRTVFGEVLQTPNLDRICAQSTAFRAAYCQAPVCGPSRASFMSGRTPHQLGVFNNRTSVFDKILPQDMWPYKLKESGYFTSSGGKVHHRYRPLPPPIHNTLYCDARKGFRIDRKLPKSKPQTRFGGHGDGLATTDPADDGYYHDAHASKSFAEFITTYDSDAPFYREVGFFGPHTPFITPVRFKEMYDPQKFHKPREWHKGFDQNPFAQQFMGENLDPSRRRRWRRSVRNYFSAVSHVDHHLGKVWDALKASPHADNTIVVLVSDHGFHLGERNRFRKTSLYEQVAQVPLIVHDPSCPEAREVLDPVALLDVGPTILDYADLPPLEDCRGVSLRDQVDGARGPKRAIPTFFFDSAGVRMGDYRFIRYADGSTQLFDLRYDWWQTLDLGPEHPGYGQLLRAHNAVCAEYGLIIPPASKGPPSPPNRGLMKTNRAVSTS